MPHTPYTCSLFILFIVWQTQLEYRNGIAIPTEKKIKNFGKTLNVTRRNHRVSNLYYSTEPSRKEPPEGKWDVDIIKIKDRLALCFGTTMADLSRATDYSKLAECRIEKEKIGWYKMVNNLPELAKYVDRCIANRELFDFQEDEEEEVEAEPEQPTVVDSEDDGDGGGAPRRHNGDDSSSDDDVPLRSKAGAKSSNKKSRSKSRSKTPGLCLVPPHLTVH